MINEIINELIEDNGTKYKLAVLNKYKDNPLLSRTLKMTYDIVAFRYYITMNHWHKSRATFQTNPDPTMTFELALDFLECQLATRHLTGHDAIEHLDNVLRSLSDIDRELLIKVINRDLRINCGRTQINKVFSNLITKPVYMRCGTFSAKTLKSITFPAIIQLKADGTYRELQVSDGKVTLLSRSGEQYSYGMEDQFADLPDGHYTGEMVVTGVKNRAEGNGLLNSDSPPANRIAFLVWDYITPSEYSNAASKIKNEIRYSDRFERLKEIVQAKGNPQLQVIESHTVDCIADAFAKVTQWMSDGLEGGVLKSADGIFRDGTSKHQLKMKLEMDIDVRVTGFKEGKIGTKREDTFGAIEFETDDREIRGAVSGLTDEQLERINKDRQAYIGKIVVVSCNDITMGRNNDYHALSHPRFKEFRTDKDETDTLQRALEIKRMAMSF